jgi:hypothetical protein
MVITDEQQQQSIPTEPQQIATLMVRQTNQQT